LTPRSSACRSGASVTQDRHAKCARSGCCATSQPKHSKTDPERDVAEIAARATIQAAEIGERATLRAAEIGRCALARTAEITGRLALSAAVIVALIPILMPHHSGGAQKAHPLKSPASISSTTDKDKAKPTSIPTNSTFHGNSHHHRHRKKRTTPTITRHYYAQKCT
jgi:hypothetical protein